MRRAILSPACSPVRLSEPVCCKAPPAANPPGQLQHRDCSVESSCSSPRKFSTPAVRLIRALSSNCSVICLALRHRRWIHFASSLCLARLAAAGEYSRSVPAPRDPMCRLRRQMCKYPVPLVCPRGIALPVTPSDLALAMQWRTKCVDEDGPGTAPCSRLCVACDALICAL